MLWRRLLDMNSRQKGARGEREAAELLRSYGFDAKRGVQYQGGPDSPDVKCDALGYHVEIKRVERLVLDDAIKQARNESGGKPYLVLHKRNRGEWLVTIPADQWLQERRLLRNVEAQ